MKTLSKRLAAVLVTVLMAALLLGLAARQSAAGRASSTREALPGQAGNTEVTVEPLCRSRLGG